MIINCTIFNKIAPIKRRHFIPLLSATPFATAAMPKAFSTGNQKFKIGLNAYSFNSMLMNKKMTHVELLEFCSRTGFDAIDITGYYFSTYPKTPSDQEIFAFKRKAHELISRWPIPLLSKRRSTLLKNGYPLLQNSAPRYFAYFRAKYMQREKKEKRLRQGSSMR
jgi:hypothetical protein